MSPIYATRIREIRQKSKQTQTEFANSIGTTKNQLSKYETGVQEIPTRIIIEVCSKYHTDANWLLGLTDNMIPMCNKCHREIERTEKFIKSKALQEEEFMLEQLQQLRDSLK